MSREELIRDHEEIFRLYEELSSKVHVGQELDLKIRRDFTRRLIDYCTAHFYKEEIEMKDSGYPNCESHKAEHQRILQHMVDEALKCCLTDNSDKILEFIRTNFLQHILTWDEAFFTWKVG